MFVALLAAIASRLVFTTLDGMGRVCAEAAPAKEQQFGVEFEFDPQAVCFASGLQIREGERYLVQMRVVDAAAWKDKAIDADLNDW